MKATLVSSRCSRCCRWGWPHRRKASVFFEEQFNGPTLDSHVWRTEILTSGSRWCPVESPGPGYWVDEGVECHGVAVYSPYGSAILSDGSLHMSSSNDRAFPYLMSRLPGATPLFPASGDFTFEVRMHFDRTTPWGTLLDGTPRCQSTDPGRRQRAPLTETDRLLQVAWQGIYLSFGRFDLPRRGVPSPTATHEVYPCLSREPVHHQDRWRDRLRSRHEHHETDRRRDGQPRHRISGTPPTGPRSAWITSESRCRARSRSLRRRGARSRRCTVSSHERRTS